MCVYYPHMPYTGNYSRGLERGFQLFKNRKHLETFRLDIGNIWCRIICSPFPLAEDQEYAYFFHRKTAVTNQNIFRTLKHMSFERANIVPQNFLHSRKLTQFPESTDSVKEGTKFASQERTPSSDKVNTFTEIPLWVRFSLFTQSAHGPGEDPFEAVMCTVGAPSQISTGI